MKYNDNGEWKDVQIKVANAIQNEYGESNNDGYSQNYLNDKVVNVGTEVDSRNRVNVLKSENLLELSLSKYQTTTLSGVTNTDNGDQTITINGTQAQNTNLYLLGNGTNTILNLKANKTYTFKLYMISGSMSGVGGNVIIGITGSANYVYKAFTSSSENVEIQITPTNDINITSIRLYSTGGGSGQTYTNLKLKAQINEGSTALPYEPFMYPSMYVDNELLVRKNVYSTGEVVIGEWLGKPLYRRVIKTVMGTCTTNGTYGTSNRYTISNAEIKNFYGTIILGGGVFPILYVDSAGRFTKVASDDGKTLILSTNAVFFSGADCEIVVEYTKSTDTVSTRSLQTISIPENDDEGEIVRGEER